MTDPASPSIAAPAQAVGPRIATLVAEALALTVVFGLLGIYTMRSMYDIDVFWHIEAGQWIVEHGALPHVDTFSAAHPERPWTPFQWLYEVLVYGLDSVGGFLLLRASHAALIVVGFALLWWTARRRLGPALAFFALTLGIELFGDRFRVRPEVFNLAFLSALLPVLLGGWRRIGWGGTLAVGALAWVWANLHAGGSLLVPVTLGGLLAGAGFLLVLRPPVEDAPAGGGLRGLWARRDPAARADFARALRLFAVAVLPMPLMPGFLRGVVTAVSMYYQSVALIPEWQEATAYFDMLDQRGVPHYLVNGFAPYVLMVLVGGFVIVRLLRRGAESVPWPAVFVSALLLYLAQRSVRFVHLSIVPVLVLLEELRGSVVGRPGVMTRRVMAGAAGLLALGAMAVSYHYNIVVQRGSLEKAVARLDEELEPGRFPVEAADFLAAAEVEGKILHFSKWGGYLLYRLWPRCSVFADGRGNFDLTQVGALVATHRPYTRERWLEAAHLLYGLDIVMFQAPVFHLMRWDPARWIRLYAGMEHQLGVEVFVRNTPRGRENLARARAFYAARSDDPRFTGEDIAAFEDAVAAYWGTRWLAAPAQARKLAELTATVDAPDAPEAARTDALFRRAMYFYNANDVVRAGADLAAAYRLDPSDARVLHYLGWCLYRTGRREQAAGALLRVGELERARPRLRADERMQRDLLLEDLMKR